ncbi:MAG: aminodeoxychorismate synthase component I [Candidatus Omnitrophica bacterium]|nr:aminodeoxychorismate synthase component I [Candidatus Omnitrophota bacterium]
MKSYKLKSDPLQLFACLSQKKDCFFLDSGLNDQGIGRYSFLGFEPFLKIKSKGDEQFKKLREALQQYKITLSGDCPPFLGGAVGYLAYDSGLAVPDCGFGLYNSCLIVDQHKKLLYLFASGFPEKKHHLSKALAETNFKKLLQQVSDSASTKITPQNECSRGNVGLRSNFGKAEYIAAVKRAKEYIRQGDIYQVNLSQRFEGISNLSGAQIYQRLRKTSPAPFSAYFSSEDFEIISSSPERFLSVTEDKVTTRPMKGTRPRSKNKKHDTRLKKELLKSAKDKAELVMIVDLERNDLGKVCEYDSIKVTAPRTLETYSTVYQTTATVEGRLHKDKNRIDLLQACFPGGSITGCPKIRAMEIIKELEPLPRSIYTGALGYLSFSGNMDFNILIRTILKKNKQVYFWVGAGIVADSDPAQEYEETLVKAKGIKEAIDVRNI